jgi:hypothetical protein
MWNLGLVYERREDTRIVSFWPGRMVERLEMPFQLVI